MADTFPGADTGSGCFWDKTGFPRSEYTYVGTNQALYSEWQACEITTDQFQTRTAPGNGTDSLRGPGLDSDGTFVGDENGDDPPDDQDDGDDPPDDGGDPLSFVPGLVPGVAGLTSSQTTALAAVALLVALGVMS